MHLSVFLGFYGLFASLALEIRGTSVGDVLALPYLYLCLRNWPGPGFDN